MSKIFSTRARSVVMVAQYAELHDLPQPRTADVSVAFGEVTLGFGSTADVDVWAQQLGTKATRSHATMYGGDPAIKAEVNASLYEIPVCLYAFDRERVAS